MKNIIAKIISSLDNHSKGFSARKLSALVVIILVVIAHIKWIYKADFTLLTEVLMLDYGFVSVCLGMTTYESIKNKSNDTSTTNTGA